MANFTTTLTGAKKWKYTSNRTGLGINPGPLSFFFWIFTVLNARFVAVFIIIFQFSQTDISDGRHGNGCAVSDR